jgi:ribonuclease VapC
MIVDASAIVAMLRREADWRRYAAAITQAEVKRMSAGTWIELGAVASRGDDDLKRRLDGLMGELNIEIAPVSPGQARLGHDAYLKFGKGRHSARLNFGDCFAYALSKETGLPLLFKGCDFSETEVVPAL